MSRRTLGQRDGTEHPRVLHVLGSLDRGGAEVRLIGDLVALGNDAPVTSFFLLSGREGALAPTARLHGATIAVTTLRRSLLDLAVQIARQRPNVVQAHVHYSSGVFLAVAWLLRVPRRIAHFHSTDDVRPGRRETRARRARRAISRRLVALAATDVIAVSEASLRSVWPTSRERPRAAVLYNGYDTERLEELAACERRSEPRLLIQVGRIEENKGQARTVRVLGLLRKERTDVSLILVGKGEGPYADNVRALVDQLGLGAAVSWAGTVEDVQADFDARATVMVAPTVIEGLPNALLEAVAVGTPVVATAIGPIGEVSSMVPGITPIAIDADDETWAAAVAKILEDPPDEAQRVAMARAFAQSVFAMERHLEHLRDLWGIGGHL